ncbi:MAG: septal ring lytic transglycosylase RlpA family protein [Pseudomonadota bacterium]
MTLTSQIRACIFVRFAALGALALIAGCASYSGTGGSGHSSPHYKVGSPYKINGRWYHPAEDPGYDRTGVASWYGDDFHGRPTANGEIFDMRRISAAHTTLPMPSMVEVTNLENGRRLVVRVNDRGPFKSNRIIDLSRAAARSLGFERAGLAKVRVRYVGPAPLPGEPQPVMVAAKPPPAPLKMQPIASSVPARAESDAIGALIADRGIDAVPFSPPDLAATPAQAPQYLIRVAMLSDLSEISRIDARLYNEGPVQVVRAEAAPAGAYSLDLGPFSDQSDADARLERVREAGYDQAEIVALSP